MLDEVIKNQGAPDWRRRERLLLAIFVIVFLWAAIAKVDRVVVATGKIIPFDKVKTIQHLEGGIIETLHVRENQRVTAGEALIELNLATSGVNVDELGMRMGALRIAQSRLVAESGGGLFQLPKELDPKLSQAAIAELQTFEARTNELKEVIESLRNQKSQSEKGVTELEARQRSQQEGLRLAQKQLDISQRLVEEKLVSELEHVERMRAVERARGEIESTHEAILGARARVDEASSRIREETARFKRRASDELGDVERTIASLAEELHRAQEQYARSIIRSPITGFVKNIKYQAIGNVVKPGEPLMEVVPEKDRLVVEVRLSPVDRGYVITEQRALVKISAYDYYRHGGITGNVESIAADTTTGEKDEQFYSVIIRLDQNFVGQQSYGLQIGPGMTSEVNIKVDSQSLLWALIRPILRIKSEAFRET